MSRMLPLWFGQAAGGAQGYHPSLPGRQLFSAIPRTSHLSPLRPDQGRRQWVSHEVFWVLKSLCDRQSQQLRVTGGMGGCHL